MRVSKEARTPAVSVKTYVYWTSPSRMTYVRATSMQHAGRLGVVAVGARGRKRRASRLDAIDAPIGVARVDVLALFRDQLDHALRSRSQSAASLSRQVGLSRNAIQRWLGGANPRLPDTLAVADALGLSLDAMLAPLPAYLSNRRQVSEYRWRESWAWLVARHGLAELSAYASKSTIRAWLGNQPPTLLSAHDACVRLGQPVQAVAQGAVRAAHPAVALRPERDAFARIKPLLTSGAIRVDHEAGAVYRVRGDRRIEITGSIARNGHIRVGICTGHGRARGIMLARLVFAASHGTIPVGHKIVHIDGDPMNNRIANLRAVPNTVKA